MRRSQILHFYKHMCLEVQCEACAKLQVYIGALLMGSSCVIEPKLLRERLNGYWAHYINKI